MAGLQRSAQTFRRSGSSGLVWDERFLTECAEAKPCDSGGGACAVRQPELRHSRSVGSLGVLRRQGRGDGGDVGDKMRKVVIVPKAQKDHRNDHEEQRKKKEAAPVDSRRAFRTRDVVPATEPPSPRVSGCVLCSIFWGARVNGGVARRRGDQGSGSGMRMDRKFVRSER